MDSGNTLLLAEPDALVTKLGSDDAVCRDGVGATVDDPHPLPLDDDMDEADAEGQLDSVAAPADAECAAVSDGFEALATRLAEGAPLLLPAVDIEGLAVRHALAAPLALVEAVKVPANEERLLAEAPVTEGATESVGAPLSEPREEAELRGEKDAWALRDGDRERGGDGEPEPLRVVDVDTEGDVDTRALGVSVALPVAREEADAEPVPGRERAAALEMEGQGEDDREAPPLPVPENEVVGALEPLPAALMDAPRVTLSHEVPLADAQPLEDPERETVTVAEVSGDKVALMEKSRDVVAQVVEDGVYEVATDGLPDPVSLGAVDVVTESVPEMEAGTDAVAGEEAENESVVAAVPVPRDALGAPEAEVDVEGERLALGLPLTLGEATPERLPAAVLDGEPDTLAVADTRVEEEGEPDTLTVVDSEAEGEGEPVDGAVREARENDGASDAVGKPLPVAPAVADTSTDCGAVCEGDPEVQPEAVMLNDWLPLSELAGLEEGAAEAQPEGVE
jgi:hypothetical protein